MTKRYAIFKVKDGIPKLDDSFNPKGFYEKKEGAEPYLYDLPGARDGQIYMVLSIFV